MPSLVLAEHNNKALADATAQTITAARQLGQPVHLLIAGHECANAVEYGARLDGVECVIVADDPLYAHHLAEPLAALILSLADRYENFLAPASTTGKSVLPRVAALLDVPQISDVTKIVSADTFERPIYAGSLLETVQAPPGKKVLTIRSVSFAKAALTGAALIASIPRGPDPALSQFLGEDIARSARPDLGSAKIVIAGGRGLQSSENFKQLERVADKLGAAIGASRAAVDAGYVPNAYQIGQTGRSVAPNLYIAVGISGAIQHLAGMTESKVIVAINKDEQAPIFQVADYGLVADLFQVLPELDAALDA